MPFPILAVAGIAIGIGSKLLGSRSRKAGEKARAAALRDNALVQLANTLSGLSAREQEELASARQSKRLGRRSSAVMAARAKAAGADAGVGSAEQVQDVELGESEFLGSIDAQLGMVTADLTRRERGARREFKSAVSAADAGVSGTGQDFLDFANIAAFALNAFDAIPSASGVKAPKKSTGGVAI